MKRHANTSKEEPHGSSFLFALSMIERCGSIRRLKLTNIRTGSLRTRPRISWHLSKDVISFEDAAAARQCDGSDPNAGKRHYLPKASGRKALVAASYFNRSPSLKKR
jgi:hypothetical protein